LSSKGNRVAFGLADQEDTDRNAAIRRSFAFLAALTPTEALAHASGRGFVLLLPTEAMQWTGAAAVALSFALIALLPARALTVLFREWTIRVPALPRIETLVSVLGLVFWTALVVVGFTGARDPLANPLPLTVWTLIWVGLTILCAVFGNIWAAINPWSGLVRLIALPPLLSLPQHIGYARHCLA
jgi:tellurite resistance protein TehA-like permease